MPRRPRPARRPRPQGEKYGSKSNIVKAATTNLSRPAHHRTDLPAESSHSGDLFGTVYYEKDHSHDALDDSEDSDEAGPFEEAFGIEEREVHDDPDGARVAQWVDEEELVPPDGDNESDPDVLKGPGSDSQLVCRPSGIFP
jgi:hypothetical protein